MVLPTQSRAIWAFSVVLPPQPRTIWALGRLSGVFAKVLSDQGPLSGAPDTSPCDPGILSGVSATVVLPPQSLAIWVPAVMGVTVDFGNKGGEWMHEWSGVGRVKLMTGRAGGRCCVT